MARFAYGAPQRGSNLLNPPAPEMDHVAEESSDGDLFWITKHGIRMTGMPAFGATHTDEDLWKIVAYVKTIPEQSQNTPAKPDSGKGHEHDHSHGSDKDNATHSEHEN